MDLNGLLMRAVELGATRHSPQGRPAADLPDRRRPQPDGGRAAARRRRARRACSRSSAGRSPEKLAAVRTTSGDLDIAYQDGDLPRFRVNAYRQRSATSFAFRVIPKTVPSFEQLNLPVGVQKLAEEHRGLILVTGATGSGKTTTLAAMIDYMNRNRKQHIITIEDPIEILHPDHNCIVNQREVGLDTESFGQALRRALRQDPDTILIGELRDAETAQTALQAAESGHLVLSTLHTIDAAETVGRMIEFFPPEKQEVIRAIMAGVLRGVISQRLLPKVDGGRVAAVEVMVMNARIADLDPRGPRRRDHRRRRRGRLLPDADVHAGADRARALGPGRRARSPRTPRRTATTSSSRSSRRRKRKRADKAAADAPRAAAALAPEPRGRARRRRSSRSSRTRALGLRIVPAG